MSSPRETRYGELSCLSPADRGRLVWSRLLTVKGSEICGLTPVSFLVGRRPFPRRHPSGNQGQGTRCLEEPERRPPAQPRRDQDGPAQATGRPLVLPNLRAAGDRSSRPGGDPQHLHIPRNAQVVPSRTSGACAMKQGQNTGSSCRKREMYPNGILSIANSAPAPMATEGRWCSILALSWV